MESVGRSEDNLLETVGYFLTLSTTWVLGMRLMSLTLGLGSFASGALCLPWMLLCEVCHIYSTNQYLLVFPGWFCDRHVPSYEKMFIHVLKLSTLHLSWHFLSPPGPIVCLIQIPFKPQTLLYLVNVSARREPVSHAFSHLHKPCVV